MSDSNGGGGQPEGRWREKYQSQRRAILRYLSEQENQVCSLEALIDHLIAVERERTDEVPGEDFILSLLVHIHAPKLEEAGLVNYDIPEQEIEYLADEKFERFLAQIDDIEADW